MPFCPVIVLFCPPFMPSLQSPLFYPTIQGKDDDNDDSGVIAQQ
jgi:hypothetical protein